MHDHYCRLSGFVVGFSPPSIAGTGQTPSATDVGLNDVFGRAYAFGVRFKF